MTSKHWCFAPLLYMVLLSACAREPRAPTDDRWPSTSEESNAGPSAYPRTDAGGERSIDGGATETVSNDAASAGDSSAPPDPPITDPLCATYFEDRDGDGLGRHTGSSQTCKPTAGWVANDDDCDDSDPSVLGTHWRPCPACEAYRVDGSCIASCERTPCLRRPECKADVRREGANCACPVGTVDMHGDGSLCTRAAQWMERFYSDKDDYATALLRDRHGSLWMTGVISRTNVEGTLHKMSLAGYPFTYLTFIAKLTANGEVAWVKTFNPHWASQFLNGLAEDDEGNIWWSGTFNKSIDAGVGTEPILTAPGVRTFLFKFDQDGRLRNQYTVGGPGPTYAWTMAYSGGHLWLSGSFRDTLQPDANHSFTSRGEKDAFIAEYDLAGNLVYLTALGGPDLDYFWIGADGSGGAFLAGSAKQALVWRERTWTFASNQNVAMVAHIDRDHQESVPLMAEPVDGVSLDSLLVSPARDSKGNIWVTGHAGGYESGISKPDPGALVLGGQRIDIPGRGYQRFLVLKLDSSGNINLLKTYGGGQDEATGYRFGEGLSVSVAPDDGVWVVGRASGVEAFGTPSEGAAQLPGGGFGLLHLSSDGRHLHSHRFPGWPANAFAAAGPVDQVWIAGGYATELDPGAGLTDLSVYRVVTEGSLEMDGFIGHFRF